MLNYCSTCNQHLIRSTGVKRMVLVTPASDPAKNSCGKLVNYIKLLKIVESLNFSLPIISIISGWCLDLFPDTIPEK